MKTKKAILGWWTNLGNSKAIDDDLLDFINTVDHTVHFSFYKDDNQHIYLILSRYNWKHTLKLCFYVDHANVVDCYRIVGF